eukprot:3121979-Rhodomonas_salina.1
MNNVLAYYKRRHPRSSNPNRRPGSGSNGRTPKSSLKATGGDGGRSWHGGHGGRSSGDVWRETSVIREPASAPPASKNNKYGGGSEKNGRNGHSRARWRVFGSADQHSQGRVRWDEVGESRLQMLEEQLRVLDTNSYL